MVRLSGEQRALTDIEIGKLEKRTLSSVIMTRGVVQPMPDGMAKVHSPMNGTISGILVDFGEKVSPGQALVRISDPAIVSMQEEYLQASLKLELLKKEYERAADLNGQGINALKEFQKIGTDLQMEKVKINALATRLKAIQINPESINPDHILPYITLRSPSRGIIEYVQAEMGKYTNREEPLFEIIDPQKLYIEGFVFEKDIRKVELGQTVQILERDTKTEKPLAEGKIISIGNRVDEDNRTVPVRIATDPSADLGLFAGMFMALGIETGSRMCYVVPEEAVVYDNENRSWIFLLEGSEDGKLAFKAFEIHTGLMEKGFVELSATEAESIKNREIAVKGAYYLYSELLKEQE